MPNVRVISKEEAQQTQRKREPGVRRQRMNQFDEYVRVLLENQDEAVVYEELDEDPLKFVITMRGAFRRAGHPEVVVRKMRGRDEVRAWIPDPGDEAPARSRTRTTEPEGVAQPPAAESAGKGSAPRRRRTRTAG